MKHNIIHIILVSLIAMGCMASCVSDPDPSSSESGEAMSFEAMEATSTRASVTTNATLTKKPFQLFGDVYRKGEFYSGLKIFFDGNKVTYKNGKWDYGEQLYWLMGQNHSFVAIHPHESVAPEISDLKYSGSTVSFTFTMPTTAEKHIDYKGVTDVLVATHRRVYTMDNAGPVKFGFRHLLTQVNIAPALDEDLMYEDETDRENYPYNEDEYVLFHKIEVYGLKTKASFTIIPAPLEEGQFATDERIETYGVGDANDTDAVIVFDNPKKITNNKTNVNICDNEATLLFLPQDIENARIVMYYTVNDDEPLRKITLPLSGTTIDKWETGKIYTYRFTLQKAYTGQIKPGSMLIEIDDPRLADTNDDAWMWDGNTISFDFPEKTTE